MSHLLLVCGLEDGVNIDELVSYLKATRSVQNVWMDPYGNPRCVVLSDRKLELKDIKTKPSIGSKIEISWYLETARHTTCVFVKTHKSITFGVKDKLKYLFTSQKHGGRKVLKVEQLNTSDDDCYELFFLTWDDVLQICRGTWKIEKQTLTVIPLFDSFKEPFKQQLKRLIEINNTATQAERSDKPPMPQKETINKPSIMPKPSVMPRKVSSSNASASEKTGHHSAKNHSEGQELETKCSSSSSVSDFTSEEDGKAVSAEKQTYPHTGSKDNLKSAKPVLEHPYILTLLHLLRFGKAVQQKYNLVRVTICESNWEVEIVGPVASVKIIQKLLTEEDEFDHSAQIETFLGNKEVLQELKAFIDTAGLYVDIVNTQGKPFLQVTDDKERKEPFHDFIFSLVVSKVCSPLPNRECQKRTEWIEFVKSFQKSYTHQHIFVEDTSVTLACLAFRSQEMDVVVAEINNIISQLKKDLKLGAHRDESKSNSDQIHQSSKMLDESSHSSGNTHSVGRKESSGINKTVCFESSLLLWILNILNLKNSLSLATDDLVVDIDEDEKDIHISGSKELLQKLKSVLVKEDKKFQFTESEQALLCDPVVRESLKSCLISHGCCILLSANLELLVASKDGQQTQFRNFLTSFIQFKTISHLPEKFQQTQEWTSLVERCKNNYPHHHILTADDQVYLLSIAPDEKNTGAVSILEELNAAITAFTSAVPPEKNLSLTKITGDEKEEGNRIDSSKIPALEKGLKRKVTLCYKHPVLLRILQTLQLKKAALNFGVCVTMSADEIFIEGPRKEVTRLESLLMQEDNEMPFEDEETLLTDEQVQQNLDTHLKDLRAHLVLDENNLELFVVTKSGEKAKFRNFLTSFIQFQTVSHLPEKFQKNEEWTSLVKHCQISYPHHHILTADDQVYLLSIAPDEKNTDAVSILKELGAAITAFNTGIHSEKSFPENARDQNWEETNIDSSKISAIDSSKIPAVDSSKTPAVDSSKISALEKGPKKKVTLCYKHPVLLRILQNLQLKEAAHTFGVYVTMSDDEIFIEGPRKDVTRLESLFMQEDNEMPFEDEETFLTDERIQQNLDTHFKDLGAHLVLDDDNLELFVVTDFGGKAKFRNFLTSFIQFMTVSLPDKFQKPKEWALLVERCENNYPHHHILTADDQVYLLSIAPDENNADTASILKELDAAITTSTSSVLPEGDFSPVKEISDQKNDGIKNVDKMFAADTSSKKKVTLCYNHPVLFHILTSLQLNKAALKLGVSLAMTSDDRIIIEGPKNSVKSLESVLIKEDNEMPFEDQEEFFKNPTVLERLDSCLEDSRAQLLLGDNLELFVVEQSGEKELFKTFITRIIRFQKCVEMPEMYQSHPAWKIQLQQFEKQNPAHLILTNAEEVYLLTISSDDKSHEANKIVERINKVITDSSLSLDSDMSCEDECHDYRFNIPSQKITYFNRYLSNELEDIYNKWESYKPKITFTENFVNIFSSSQEVTSQIASQLTESFFKIENLKKTYSFPGLPAYVNSSGSDLLKSLSDKHRCLIEIRATGDSNPQRLSLNEDQSSNNLQELEYNVIFLGTFNCGGFNIHLVQGDMDALNLKMKIQLQPSEEVERCEVGCHKSSQNVFVRVPPWSASSESSDRSRMEKVRKSFNEQTSVAFEQAKCLKHSAIAFSTAPLTKSGHPFPASLIAKEIVEVLYEKNGSNLASSQSENVDIYICDPGNEALFSAFTFFLKLRHAYFGPPSQFAWDKVSFPDSYTYPDYNRSRGIQIEVSSKIPNSLGNSSSVFYPIHPSLEMSSCPAFKEHISAERSLKSSLNDLQRYHQDGLVSGEVVPLKGFFDGRNSFVYCSPDWGVNCDKDIEKILENCARKADTCDVMYIIPPGMQMQSKYPVGYLAQVFFRKLDSILQNKTFLLQRKKCVLLVQDLYKKSFDRELQKRCPKTEERGFFKSFFQPFINFFNSPEEEKITDSRKTISTKSHVQRTEIVFWGTHEHCIQRMAQDLEKHLKDLMKTNTVTMQLNKENTYRFKKKVENIENRHVQVSISLTEIYDIKKKDKKRNKKKNPTHETRILSGSVLTLQGLQKNYVEKFLDYTGLDELMEDHRNTVLNKVSQDHGTTVIKEESHEETSVPLKNVDNITEKETCTPLQTSVKSTTNANRVDRNDSQQKKDCKLSKQENASSSSLLQRNYKWLRESDCHSSFEMVKLSIQKDIEDAYIKGKDQQELTGDITHVDFKSMTATKNNKSTGLIRTEDFGPAITQKCQKLIGIKENTEQYRNIMSKLDECIKKYKLFSVEVSKVPQNCLHVRFEQKCAHLNDKNYSWLWHRTLNNCKQYVCRYGFHPRFSGMPEAKRLGEGVLFFKDPDMLFTGEIKNEEEIHLLYSKVYLGRSGTGAPGLRCIPPADKPEECFDSVSEGEAYMIFSDAQACPEFVVTLKFT